MMSAGGFAVWKLRPIRGAVRRQQDRRGRAATASWSATSRTLASRLLAIEDGCSTRLPAIAGAKPPADVRASPTESAPSKGLPGMGRAPSDHSHVLRSSRLDESRRKARRRRIGASWSTPISAKASAAVTGAWRPRAEKARRRADGAVFGYPHAQENDAERAVRARRLRSSALFRPSTPENAANGAPEPVGARRPR